MKVFVVGPAVYYAKFLKNVELVEKQEDADVVLFTGGFQMLGQSSNKQYLVGRYTGDCYSGFDRPFVFRDEKDKFNIKSFYKICKLLMKSAVIK